MELDVRVLCPVSVNQAGRPVGLGYQARVVLAMLALQPGTLVSVDQLVDALWPGRPPRTARMRVHNLVSKLRQALGCPAAADPGCVIATQPAGYRLRLAASQLDLGRFRELLASAEQLRAAGQTELAARRYAEALEQWSGPPCGDLDHPAVRDLVEPLLAVHADVLEDWAELALRHDDARKVAARLSQAVAQYPFRERMRGLLMRSLHHAGRAAEALRVYEQGRRLIANELGVDPSAPLQRLYRELLSGMLHDLPPDLHPSALGSSPALGSSSPLGSSPALGSRSD